MIKLNSIKSKLQNAERYLSDTPMKTKWLYLRRKILRRFNPWVPRQLWIGITYKCQCQCRHCILGPHLNKNEEELKQQDIYNLINTARHLGFLEAIYFGGEPLLNEKIKDFIRFSSSKGLLTSVYTNGILLNKNIVRQLRESGLYACNISLDSASSQEHNSLRGYNGCFEKAIDGIKYLLGEGIKCNIWTYAKKTDIQEQNLKDLKAIIEIGRQLKVDKVVILFPMASGNWLCGAGNILTQSEREMVRALCNPPFIEFEFPSEESYCSGGKRMVYVTPKGDITPCPTLPNSFGNYHQESLKTILKRMHSNFNNSKIKGCGQCIMNSNAFREKIGIGKIEP